MAGDGCACLDEKTEGRNGSRFASLNMDGRPWPSMNCGGAAMTKGRKRPRFVFDVGEEEGGRP